MKVKSLEKSWSKTSEVAEESDVDSSWGFPSGWEAIGIVVDMRVR